MLADVSVCKELYEAFHHYIQVYFRERNLQATLQAVLPDLTGFGSGKDERFFLVSVMPSIDVISNSVRRLSASTLRTSKPRLWMTIAGL